jgi:hypothetical protein
MPSSADAIASVHDVTVIKINAITVPEGSGDELGRRFAARAGAVDDQDGFEGFELLKPTDDRTTWLVITRWRDEEPGVRARAPGGRPAGAARRAGVGVERAVVVRGLDDLARALRLSVPLRG